MAKAIQEVFHESNHCLCVWNNYQNVAKHLNHVFHSTNHFAFELGVYDYEEEDEWLDAWNNMLKEYDLLDNEWLAEIFSAKEK